MLFSATLYVAVIVLCLMRAEFSITPLQAARLPLMPCCHADDAPAFADERRRQR